MIKKNKGSRSQFNLPNSNNQQSKSAVKIAQQPRFCYQKKYKFGQASFSPDHFQEATERLPITQFKLENKSFLIKENTNKTPKFHINSLYEETKDYKPLTRQPSKQIVRDISTGNFNRDQSTMVNLWQTFGKQQTPAKKESIHIPCKPSAPALQSRDLNREKKSSYRLKYEYSNNYLLDTKKSSYYQFIRDKKELQPSDRKSIFVENSKFKPQISLKKGGADRSYKFPKNKHFY